jgi:O-antigen ligase
MNKKIRDQSQTGILWAGLSLTTLYFNPRLYDPFNTPKLIILLTISGWMLGRLLNFYRINPLRIKSYDFKLFGIIFALVISLLISFIGTDVKLVGFIGDTQRRNGVITYLALIIFLVYSYTNTNVNNFYGFIKTSIVVGFISSMYGLLQLANKDFIKWNNTGAPVLTTLGNQNFASALLALLALISLLSLIQLKLTFIYKLLSYVSIPASLIAIAGSNSRQGFVSFIFGLSFFFFVYSIFFMPKLKYILVPLVPIIFVGIILGMLQKGPLERFLYKDSVSVRGFYWRAATEMFFSNPITGVGLDRYEYSFKEFRELDYPLRYGFEITSSNAHNTILQLFATGGFFVGLFYITLLIYIFIRGIKSLRIAHTSVRIPLLILLSAWISFQAQSIISIDNIGISVWGWVLGGLILSLSNLSTEETNAPSAPKYKISLANQVNSKFTAQFLSIFITVPIVIFSSFLYRPESQLWKMSALVNQPRIDNLDQVLALNNSIFTNPLADDNYKFKSALVLVDFGLLEKSYSQIYSLHSRDGRNSEVIRWLSMYHTEKKNFLEAIKYRNLIGNLDPYNADNLLQLGLLYKQAGNFEKMNEIKILILSFANSDPIAKLVTENLK